MAKKILLAVIVCALIFSACKKENEELKTAALSEYVPLEVGKYIIYQLDSFRFPPRSLEGITITYQVKYLVDAAITDNLGRPAYRIVRSIRKTASDEWQIDNSFTATNTTDNYEYIDENFRFIKLHLPIKNGFSWKGNSFTNTTTQIPEFNYSYLADWDYVYDSVDAPLTLGSVHIDSTIKVAQRDEVIGNPDDLTSYSEKNYGVEYYAKGIGLVYKKLLHTEYQPPTSSTGYYSDFSKGITLTMLEHN